MAKTINLLDKARHHNEFVLVYSNLISRLTNDQQKEIDHDFDHLVVDFKAMLGKSKKARDKIIKKLGPDEKKQLDEWMEEDEISISAGFGKIEGNLKDKLLSLDLL